MDRIDKLCSYLDECDSFADVGCDHGYCTLNAFKSGKCNTAVVADVSEKCLKKAEALLADYISAGRCTPICCDGLKEIPENVGQVLIAGMGGEEIIKILSQGFIPQKFVLQPMKNADKLRAYLINRGCFITADDIFTDGKNYYFVIKGGRQIDCQKKENYSELQLKFGRDSLKNLLLKGYAQAELRKRNKHLAGCKNAEAVLNIMHDISLYMEVLK